ncbi:hypothetical protein MP638_001433 [Amoeboaphelidium occidentale]|nr:hypothetical protein MP638_001433 [Amoeboaphelidium occidentale]
MGKKNLKVRLQSLQEQQAIIRKKQKHAEKLVKEKNAKSKQESIKQYRVPFQYYDNILLIGEGNFSFARALMRLFDEQLSKDVLSTKDQGVLFATSYDSGEVSKEKYPDVCDILKELKDLDHFNKTRILYNVDGTLLSKTLKQAMNDPKLNPAEMKWDKIAFNFPHTGAGIKDEQENIKNNQKLMLGFFNSAKELMDNDTELIVTMKAGWPYDGWQIKLLAKQCGLKAKRASPFYCDKYPGYEHRRTIGFEEGISKVLNEEIKKANCKTFCFVKATE